MRFSKTELELFLLIARDGVISLNDVSFLSKSRSSTLLNKLIQKGLIEKNSREFIVSSHRFSRILSNLLLEDSSLIEALANEGIPLLMCVISGESLNIKKTAEKLGVSKITLYPYMKRLVNKQIIYEENGKYFFNKSLWNTLYQFLNEYRSYLVTVNFKRLPRNAKIYYEDLYEVVFSMPFEINQNIPKTAFSMYEKYGILLRENEVYYRLDDEISKKPKIKNILLDSIRIAKNGGTSSIRRRIYCYLFYKKNLARLRHFKHPDLEILKSIVNDKNFKPPSDFPTRDEILEKCEDYDIQI